MKKKAFYFHSCVINLKLFNVLPVTILKIPKRVSFTFESKPFVYKSIDSNILEMQFPVINKNNAFFRPILSNKVFI